MYIQTLSPKKIWTSINRNLVEMLDSCWLAIGWNHKSIEIFTMQNNSYT